MTKFMVIMTPYYIVHKGMLGVVSLTVSIFVVRPQDKAIRQKTLLSPSACEKTESLFVFLQSTKYCYRFNVYCPPIYMLNPDPKCDSILEVGPLKGNQAMREKLS